MQINHLQRLVSNSGGLNQLQVGVAARLGGLQEHGGEYNAVVAHCHHDCNMTLPLRKFFSA
jgi:hypothetical protein